MPWRRFAVLGLAIAVPVMAFPPGALGVGEGSSAGQASAIASELPAHNFPGSAFYFLEDAPPLAQDVALTRTAVSEQVATHKAARPLQATGSDRDHARAQRCLTMALHYEASSESLSGQRAVAQVILNRVAHPAFPSTVCGVVFEGAHRTTGCQFSFACDGATTRRVEAGFNGSAARVARQALAGQVYAPVGYATHYHTLDIHPYWADSLTNLATVGSHTFYRWSGAQGLETAFTTRYAGGEPAPGFTTRGAGSVAQAPTMAYEQVPQAAALIEEQAPVARDSTTPVPAASASAFKLPNSGQVREEYANSGQWLDQP